MAKVKGTVVVELQKMLEPHRLQPAGMQAFESLGPRAKSLLEEKIVLASWYSLDDYVAILRAFGRVGSANGIPLCESLGREMARTHMEGTYSRYSKSTDRKTGSLLLSAFYDTGEMRVVERESGWAVVELVGFATPCKEICESITGYQYQRLALMNFDDLSVRHTKCRGIGQPSCLWEMSWKARSG